MMTKHSPDERKLAHIRWLLQKLNSPSFTWECDKDRLRFYALMDHFVPEFTGVAEARLMLKQKLIEMAECVR